MKKRAKIFNFFSTVQNQKKEEYDKDEEERKIVVYAKQIKPSSRFRDVTNCNSPTSPKKFKK